MELITNIIPGSSHPHMASNMQVELYCDDIFGFDGKASRRLERKYTVDLDMFKKVIDYVEVNDIPKTRQMERCKLNKDGEIFPFSFYLLLNTKEMKALKNIILGKV